MDMKKVYTEPLCEVTRFEVEDIVTASNWDGGEFDAVSDITPASKME